MRFLIINGPNMNLLGIREPKIYGEKTYKELLAFTKKVCRQNGIRCSFFFSNCEGKIVSKIGRAIKKYDGIIINPAAYTHTSLAIADALRAVDIPYAEVHLSDVQNREQIRNVSFIRENAVCSVCGLGFESYEKAIILLKEHLAFTD